MKLNIGEVSGRTGLSTHVLRKYEREGLLLSPVERDSCGRRVYDPIDVDWLQNCVRFRQSGMPLADIRTYVELVKAGDGNETDRMDVLRRHRERLESEISSLISARELVDYKLSLYERHLDSGHRSAPWAEEVRPTTQHAKQPLESP